MKFLVSTHVQEFRSVLGDDTSHVCFCQHHSGLSSQINGRDVIDVWICEGGEVTEALMDQWLDRNWNSPKTLLVNDAKFIPNLENLSKGRVAEIQAISKEEQRASSWVISTLRKGEMLYARACARGPVQHNGVTLDHDTKKTVLIVGAGIMNLVTAEFLAIRGFQVRIVDAGPDPRTCKDWTLLGATHAGGNARMFSYTEADNYNERGSDIYHNMRHIFRKTTLNGGWSVKSPLSFSAAEEAWVNAFEQVPIWLAQAMKEDIYYVNREAGKLWTEYMDRAPQLFEGVSLHTDILRLYAEETALAAAYELSRDLGVVVQDLSQAELLKENTGFSAAARFNDLAGGLIVQGFTLGIHSFVNKLIDRILELGGEFSWNCPVQRIRHNASGEVTSLESQLGALQADNFVISTGVARNGLLDGTASENLLQGVLGVWLKIPNLDPMLRNSTKIHRRGYLVEDINVTVSKDVKTGEDILILGGGYGYVGLDWPSLESPELQALFKELEEVALTYFPAGYQRAKERGTLWLDGERKFCIRPFTCTGLGIFEDIPTATGGHLIITGGNNTGGFAQAPAIARAVCRAMVGEHDPIHVLFNPHRSKLVDQKARDFRFVSSL
ncbi:nucleotide-binding domain-containing protein [Westerdykella ornata]|uniref:Nucleotide-binding domain-containing protein n=1 Tax=Westerdykella ornata TaxID=318751 RepID=A0A6A6JAN7_WESOR|nr:nucleotide-binding domain-containing protein [Westerdykella ornata]KAF2272259.1 nucleotide-binding domain-containing protein [Westerdykella ornata]